jgi:hypothetical protein
MAAIIQNWPGLWILGREFRRGPDDQKRLKKPIWESRIHHHVGKSFMTALKFGCGLFLF